MPFVDELLRGIGVDTHPRPGAAPDPHLLRGCLWHMIASDDRRPGGMLMKRRSERGEADGATQRDMEPDLVAQASIAPPARRTPLSASAVAPRSHQAVKLRKEHPENQQIVRTRAFRWGSRSRTR